MRKLILLSALILATASAVPLHAQAIVPGKTEIYVHNSSKRAMWITIYLKPRHGDKVAFSCAPAGVTTILTARIFVTRPEYWAYGEVKDQPNFCNGSTTGNQNLPVTTSSTLWVVPQHRDQPDSMPVLTAKNPF